MPSPLLVRREVLAGAGSGLAQLPGLTSGGWYRSDSGLWQTSTATVLPASGEGDPVGLWNPLVGSVGLAQPTAGNRPKVSPAAAAAGYPGIVFDGSTSYLIGNALAAAMAGEDHPYTMALVIKPPLGDVGNFWCWSGATSAAFVRGLAASGNFTGTLRDDANDSSLTYIGPAQDGKLHAVLWTSDGKLAQLYRDNGASPVLSGALTAADTGPVTATRFELGRFTAFNSAFTAAAYYDVLILPRVMSAAERQTWFTYALRRYGLA